MAEAGLRFADPSMQAMGLGLSPDPRAPFDPSLAQIGTDQLTPNAADTALTGQPSPPVSQFSASVDMRPPPARLRRPGIAQQPAPAPTVLYSPSLDRFSVGGVEFGREDYDVALQAPQLIGRPNQPQTPSGDWQAYDLGQYQRYLSSISEGRGLFGGLAVGARNVGEGLIGGTGRGLQIAGQRFDSPGLAGAGEALVGVGEAIGLSPAEQARSAAISERQGLGGKVGTAIVESIPSLGTAIGAGLAGAAVGGPVGAIAGIALSILPMELQSSWEAAEQNGLDTTDSEVQTDILMSTLFKTAAQTAGPAVIARGFSPALRTIVNNTVKRKLGQRIARGVGAGALEGSAEAIAEITDLVVFNPELRAQLNDADYAALASSVAARHGEQVLVAFLAGAALAGPLGALGTPTQAAPRREDAPPRRDVSGSRPTDMLSGAKLDPRAAPDTQGELFAGANLGAPPSSATDFTSPSQQPGFQMELPLRAPVQPTTPEIQLPLPLQAAPGTQANLFGTTPAFPQAAPVPPAPVPPVPPAPVQPAGYTGPQAEMFTPSAMGIDAATQARLTGQRLEGTRPVIPEPTAAGPEPLPAGYRPELEAAGQRAMELTAQPTAMGEQLTALLERQNRLRQQAEAAAAAARAREEAARAAQEAAAAQESRQRTRGEDQLLRAQSEQVQLAADTDSLGEQLVGENFDLLGADARAEWNAVVAALDPEVRAEVLTGEPTTFAGQQAQDALALKGEEVRPRVSNKRRQQAKQPPTIIEPAAAPSALPEGVFGTAKGEPFKNKTTAQLQRKRVASRENVPIDRLETVEVPGGWGLRARPETPPTPPKGGALKRGKTSAVQEPSPAPRPVRKGPEASGRVRGEDTQGQETAGARVEEEAEVQQPGVQIVEGRGGRLELESVASAKPEAETRSVEGVVAADLAEVEALIEDVETTLSDRDAAQSLATLVEWSKEGTLAAKERASEFLTTLEKDEATAKKVAQARLQVELGNEISKARGAVDKARADVAANKKNAVGKLADAEAKLQELFTKSETKKDPTSSIIETIEQINAGKIESITTSKRGQLTAWWREAKKSDPQYNKRPLADYIKGDGAFFNYGPDVNGHKQVVPKDTGRTSRVTFNFTGGKFNNLDGSPVTRSLPHGRAKMLISNFKRKLKRVPNIREFTNVAQLKQKNPALYARAAAAREQGDFDNVTAAGYSFGDGEVIIFTDNVANENHLRFVLAHETMGHYGLRGFIPAAEFDKTMESIYDQFPHIQGPVDNAMANVDGLSKSEAIEEYLSDYAALLETNLLRRVWNAVKNALNALGLKFADDYPRYLINHARQYARTPNRGHFTDIDVIAQRAHGVETGAFAPGRYKRSDEVFGTMEQAFSVARLAWGDAPVVQKAKGKALTDVPNAMEAFKNEYLSLFQFQSRKNPGLLRLAEIVQKGIDIALYTRNILNETMAPALNLAVRIPGTNIEFGGMRDADTAMANNALAVARIRAAQKLRDNPKLSQSNTPIFTLNETTGQFEETIIDPATGQTEADRLDALSRLTRKEFDSEFTAVLKRDTGEAQTFKYVRDPNVTNTDRAWAAYEATRDALLAAEKQLLNAKLQANTSTIDGALEEIASLMPENRLTAEQRRLIRKTARLYSDLYSKGVGVDPQTGALQINPDAVAQAEEFLQAFNTAIIADKSATEDTDLSVKESAATRNKNLTEIITKVASKQEADDIVASVEKFKELIRKEVTGQPGKYVSGLRNDKFFIQQKISALNAAQFTASNGEQAFRTTITGQYTPITQEGKYQARAVPVDENGEPVALGDAYGGSMGYTQFDTQSEANAFAEQFKKLMLDEDGSPLMFEMDTKGPAGEDIKRKIRFELRVDAVETEITAPLQLNLNEFMLGVMRYGIPLKPAKMEEIMLDLTRQDDRARKRLLTEFTAGDPRNGIKNIATHIDGRASTIAKTLMRPEVERLMSRRNMRSRELWDGDPKRVAATKARYERLMTDRGASREQVDAARRDYEEAQMLFNETGGMPNKFKNQAGKVLAFMNNNERIAESDFDSNKYIARWRNLTANFQLGLSFITAALNPISVYTNAAPYLATRNSKTAFGGGFGMGKTIYEINRAFKQVGLPGTLPTRESAKFNEASFWDTVRADPALQKKYGVTDFEARMLAQEIRQGSMQPALTNAMSNTGRGMATTGLGQKTIDVMMFMFNVSEQASRRAAGLAAFRMEFARRTNSIDPDLKGAEYDAAVEQAYRDTVKFVSNMLRETLGGYETINRPNFFRGGLAGMLYMYQVFPTTSIQLFNNMDMTGKMWMLASLWVLGGIAAWPFAEEIEDLLDTLDQLSEGKLGVGTGSIRAWGAQQLDQIQPGLGKWMFSGVAGQIMPVDTMSRVMLSPVPGSEFFLAGTDKGRMYEEIAGPMPSALFGTGRAILDAVRAPFSSTITMEDVAREAPITGVRLLADTYAYLNSGAIIDRRGYVVEPELRWYDIASRLAGGYPASAAERYGVIRVTNRVANYRREMSAQYRSEWVQASIRGDNTRRKEIEDDVREWNKQHRGTPLEIANFRQSAQRALREARRSATERTLRTTPAAGRAGYEDIMDALTR